MLGSLMVTTSGLVSLHKNSSMNQTLSLSMRGLKEIGSDLMVWGVAGVCVRWFKYSGTETSIGIIVLAFTLTHISLDNLDSSMPESLMIGL
jgi:hypothetical protein